MDESFNGRNTKIWIGSGIPTDTIYTNYYYTLDLVSTNNPNAKPSLMLYPNPTKDAFSVELNETGHILIYDIGGRLVKNQVLNPNQSVNVSDLNPGVYICNISSNQEVFIERIVVE